MEIRSMSHWPSNAHRSPFNRRPMSAAETPVHSSFVCPSCGTESVGKFCTSCGERKLGTEDRSLRHYLDIVVDFLTHFDTKGYRSLRYLITKPGFLSVEQLRGSRVRYAKPLSLFISINVVYYLSIAVFGANTFTTPLSVQLHQNDYYPGLASRQLERHLQAHKTDFATLEAKYNERTNVLSKTLIFLFIPIYALVFHAFFFRHRPYIVEHAVVATHLWSFILLLLAVVVPAIRARVDGIAGCAERRCRPDGQRQSGLGSPPGLHRRIPGGDVSSRLRSELLVFDRRRRADWVVVLSPRLAVPLFSFHDYPAFAVIEHDPDKGPGSASAIGSALPSPPWRRRRSRR
jgi:hypothetical protein